MIRRLAVTAVGLGGVGCAVPASACSVASDYVVPTPLEMAAAAEAIVIARVDGARPGRSPQASEVLATPTVLIKGRALPARVLLPGAGLADAAVGARRSNSHEVRTADPDPLSGGCGRALFSRGMQLVLFLHRDAAGALVPYRSAFARDAENVSGPDALWVKTVGEYAAIGGRPRAEWSQRLASRAAALRRAGDRDGAAIAADMDVERARLRRAVR